MKLTLVIVDDDEDMLLIMRRFIQREYPDVEIITHQDARSALANGIDGANLLVTDWRLPGMSGHELVHELRAKGLRIPMILTSYYPENVTRAFEAGADRFLDKMEIHQLPALIRELLPAPAR